MKEKFTGSYTVFALISCILRKAAWCLMKRLVGGYASLAEAAAATPSHSADSRSAAAVP